MGAVGEGANDGGGEFSEERIVEIKELGWHGQIWQFNRISLAHRYGFYSILFDIFCATSETEVFKNLSNDP